MRKFRSITSAVDANVYVGPFGEIVVDNSGQLRIQDNATAGGHIVAVTGDIRFDGSSISTINPSSNIVINSDTLTVSNNIDVGNLSISNNNITSYSDVLAFDAGGHKLVFRDISNGLNIGPGAILKFDNIENSNGPVLYTWYGQEGNPYDPPGQHSLDIIGGSNADIDYVEFASYNWDNYVGVDNTKAFIHTNWNNDPTQAWVFLKTGAVTLTPQGIINSFNQTSNIDLKDSNVYIGTVNQNTSTPFGILLENGNITVGGNVVPSGNVAYDLGSPDNQWRHLYVSSNTIYIGGVPLTVTNGDLTVNGNAVVGGSGLSTITVPAVPAVTYKGLQAAYGVIHSNSNPSELNVNKIVIYKPTNATITIDPTGVNDDFMVSGIGSSDVLAMFILYGDTNGPKALSTLQAFTEAAIDNVILAGGVEGAFNTVDAMKSAFYTNYATLATAANGLYTNFQFYSVNTNYGVSAVSQMVGSGFVFSIASAVEGMTVTPTAAGSGYGPGNKIIVNYTEYGASDGRYNIIVTVSTVDETGGVLTATAEPELPGYVYSYDTWTGLDGTNMLGNGFNIYGLNYNLTNDTIEIPSWNGGNGYYVGDRFKILGTDIYDAYNNPLASPANDLIVTVTGIVGGGGIVTFTVSGTIPRPANVWPYNNIGDGGADQYDNGNYIDTNLATEILYNGGNTVVDGSAAFGAGSSYSFVYDTAIFGLFVTGSSATRISTSGGSGADGNSTTEAGTIYDAGSPQQTITNAVTHINVYGTPYVGAAVDFVHTDNGSEVDILIPDDGNGAGVGITRSNNQGIYNPYREGSWNSSVSPGGTLWNIDGWTDLTNVQSRIYAPLYETFGFGGLGNKIVGTECIMYLPDNGKYYTVKFSSWTQNSNGGGFAYTRQELDLNSLEQGIKFPDGTRLTSAAGLGRVKSTASRGRRIEEVTGDNTVSVTPRVTQTPVSATVYDTRTDFYVFIQWDQALYDLSNSPTSYSLEFSQDNSNWYPAQVVGSNFQNYIQLFMTGDRMVTVNQGDTVYYRVSTGNDPVVWWDAADLPSGSGNMRGAIIDYHAYVNAGTIIGTIHIARDTGDENITHTETSSGGSNLESHDLWNVVNEGQIRYRTTDGQGSTLKVQWIAKIFYGEEFYD